MPTTITLEHDNFSGTIRAHRVYAKTNWDDEWVLKEHLICTMARWTCAPQVASASLYYRYGHAIVPGNPDAGYLEPFTLPTLAYVKIEFDVLEILDDEDEETETTLTWYGIVGSLVEQYGGSIAHNGSYVPQGVQQLNAVGLEWLLDRQYVTDCWFVSNEEANTPTKINVALPFNLPRREQESSFATPTSSGTVQSANRSRAEVANWYTYVFVDHVETEGTRYFDDELAPDETPDSTNNWSTKDIVQYLLTTQAPRSVNGSYPIRWILNDTNNILPTWDKPELEQHGMRVWQLLNQLISRQRCMGFYLQVDSSLSTDVIHLVPFTFTESTLTVPYSTDSLPANANQKDVKIFNDLTASLSRSTDCFSKYDQVRVVGARAVHVATLGSGPNTDSLAASWQTGFEQDDFLDGAENESDFPATTELDECYKYEQIWREQLRFKNVYRQFRIPLTWNLKTIPYPDTDEQFPVFPKDPDNAPMLYEPRDFPFDVLQIVPLPFWYDGAGSKQRTESVPCRVFFKSRAVNSGWVSGNEAKGLRDIDGNGEDEEFFFSIRVNPLPEPCKFELLISGAPRVKLAYSYTRHDWEPDYGGEIDVFDSEEFRITVGLTADYFCEAKYPADDQLPAGSDLHRVRIINAGDNYRLCFVPKGTNFYVMPNNINGWDYLDYIDFDSRYMIDDRPKLLQIATQAYGWYGRDRISVNLQTRLITNGLSLGDMIASIYPNAADPDSSDTPEAVEVNTVVTSITLTHDIGNGFTVPPPRIEYSTEHAEFDFLSFATRQV